MPKIIDDERVFQAVIQTLVVHGYDGATTRQMAAAAGISEVTLFRKYGSKAALVQLAILDIADRLAFEAIIAASGDVYQDLVQIVVRYQSLVAEYGEFLSVLIPAVHRHAELAAALPRPVQVMRAIGQLLVHYQAAGALRPEPPLHGVAALLGPLVYFAMLRRTAFEAEIPAIDPRQHVRRFLDGRRPGGTPAP